jgi:hypothetical protein
MILQEVSVMGMNGNDNFRCFDSPAPRKDRLIEATHIPVLMLGRTTFAPDDYAASGLA